MLRFPHLHIYRFLFRLILLISGFYDMASRYDLLEYDSDEEQEGFPEVPLANLTSAALFVADLLERAGIVYGVMGGFAVRLLGGNRATRDVDIAFQAPGNMKDLWRTVEHESRHVDPKWNITY